jgi:hypothetical protein
MSTKRNIKPLPQQQEQYFYEVVQSRLTKINSLIVEQRSATTAELYEMYRASIDKYCDWFHGNNVIITVDSEKQQYVLVEIKKEQGEH